MNRILVTVAAGCAMAVGLFWPREASPHNPITTTVLFNREIATLFQSKCLQCHAAGGMAMSLATYEEARPWAVAIKEEILDRRMPPWPAERGYGEFANDLGLTTRERDFLISWIDGGTPEGEVKPPAYLDHSAHWMLGNPDVLLTASAGAIVEPGRPVGFTRIIMDTTVSQERWLRAFDYKPADTRVVRAAFFTLVETGQYLGAWTPWRTTVQVPDDVGIRIPAHARIAIDVLYQPVSDLVVDTPRLGLYFTAKRPAREMATTVLKPLQVPTATGAFAPRLTAMMVVPSDTSIVDMRPEMGPGGRSIEVKAKRPDGSSQVLLWIRKFRQEWQTSYVFRQPLRLPKGSVVQAVAYFDPAPGQRPSQFTLTFSSYEPAPGGLIAAFGPRPPAPGR
ncbi:MAG: cytochrome c [Acidobacteria bacterium]|nr:cytochrome c [Acidobacteriota bacterium]